MHRVPFLEKARHNHNCFFFLPADSYFLPYVFLGDVLAAVCGQNKSSLNKKKLHSKTLTMWDTDEKSTA